MDNHNWLGAVATDIAETATRVVDMIDKASVADNQWLFICSQVLLLTFGAGIIWFLMKREQQGEIENKAERKEVRTEMEKERSRFCEIIDGYREEIGKLSAAVDGLNKTLAGYDRDVRAALIHTRLRKEDAING